MTTGTFSNTAFSPCSPSSSRGHGSKRCSRPRNMLPALAFDHAAMQLTTLSPSITKDYINTGDTLPFNSQVRSGFCLAELR